MESVALVADKKYSSEWNDDSKQDNNKKKRMSLMNNPLVNNIGKVTKLVPKPKQIFGLISSKTGHQDAKNSPDAKS